MAKILFWGAKQFYLKLTAGAGGGGPDPDDPAGLDFSKASNSQYLLLLEDI
jgi:hypothetical protein